MLQIVLLSRHLIVETCLNYLKWIWKAELLKGLALSKVPVCGLRNTKEWDHKMNFVFRIHPISAVEISPRPIRLSQRNAFVINRNQLRYSSRTWIGLFVSIYQFHHTRESFITFVYSTRLDTERKSISVLHSPACHVLNHRCAVFHLPRQTSCDEQQRQNFTITNRGPSDLAACIHIHFIILDFHRCWYQA